MTWGVCGGSWQLGDDTTQWDNCNADGPTAEHHFGRIRVPQTAIGLGIQLESDKGWKPSAFHRAKTKKG